MARWLDPGRDTTLLSRVEDAGLNASAPPQQRWMDGWLLRFNPGKAKRARCINALAPGRLPLDEKLRLAAELMQVAALPLLVRITPFTQPPELDTQLAQRCWVAEDNTRVMVSQTTLGAPAAAPMPSDICWKALGPVDFAEAVGELRGTPPAQRRAHAQRLALSPVPYQGWAICSAADGTVLACGQFVVETSFVGLYDVFTRQEVRGQGLGRRLCERMLSLAASQGARTAYLQVEAENQPARALYQRLGFADAYAYHYRSAPPG